MNAVMNGLWIAQFEAGEAHGKGLAVLHSGEVLGGDFAHTWVGSYRQEGSSMYARVRIAPFNGHAAAEHPEQPVMVTLTGSCTEEEATLAGHADESDVPVSIEMHKAASGQ